MPEPIRTRETPRITAAGSPLGSRPTCSMVARVPTGEYLPFSRGTSSSCGLVSLDSGADAASRAASMAARTSAPEVSSGTTMVGSTMVSSSGSTGSERVSGIALTSCVAFT